MPTSLPFRPGRNSPAPSKPGRRRDRVCRGRPRDRLFGLGRGASEARHCRQNGWRKCRRARRRPRLRPDRRLSAPGYYALKQRGELKSGETLAVLGASRHRPRCGRTRQDHRARASSPAHRPTRKASHSRASTAPITAWTPSGGILRDGLKALGGEHGIDVVYDPVGDKYAEPALRSLAWLGSVVVGFAAGGNSETAAQPDVLLKGCDVRSLFWGSWTTSATRTGIAQTWRT